MQLDDSGRSEIVLTDQEWHWSQPHGLSKTEVLANVPKCLRKTKMQPKGNIKPKSEANGQGHLETVHLSDHYCEEYQNPCNVDEP